MTYSSYKVKSLTIV